MEDTSQTASSRGSAITRAETEREQEVVSMERRRRRGMSPGEEDLIHRLHRLLGDRWLLISQRLPDRSAEEVKRYWKEVERKTYRETKLFKPKCLRPSSSFKYHMEATIDKNVDLSQYELLDHVPGKDDTTFATD